MNMKKLLRKAARTRKQKAQVERMSEAEARQVLADMDLSFESMTDEQKQATTVLQSVNKTEEK